MRHDDQTYQGFHGTVIWDDTLDGPRPGVLVFHTVAGRGQGEIEAAERLAAMGYCAFVADTYGEEPSEATTGRDLMDALNDDRDELRRRLEAAVDWMEKTPFADTRRAAIGFCFGGKCALDLARSGADLRAVVSFHGLFDKPSWSSDASIKPAVLALHGWDDPLATPEQTVGFAAEMTERGADWQILAMGHVGHAFTNPAADDKAGGKAYDARATERAWALTEYFLADAFAEPPADDLYPLPEE